MNQNKSELDIKKEKWERDSRVVAEYLELLGVTNPSATLTLSLLRQADSLKEDLSLISRSKESQEICRWIRQIMSSER